MDFPLLLHLYWSYSYEMDTTLNYKPDGYIEEYHCKSIVAMARTVGNFVMKSCDLFCTRRYFCHNSRNILNKTGYCLTCVAISYSWCTSRRAEPAMTTMYLKEIHFHFNLRDMT
jgi:hypothetical protein